MVSIKFTKDRSVLRVSLPCELYMTCPEETLSALKASLESQPLPPQWFLSSSGASLCVFKIQHQESAVQSFILVHTAHSFIKLMEYIFTLPGICVFLSQRISQDPLENYYGCQRQHGGTHDNPKVQEYQKNSPTQATEEEG